MVDLWRYEQCMSEGADKRTNINCALHLLIVGMCRPRKKAFLLVEAGREFERGKAGVKLPRH